VASYGHVSPIFERRLLQERARADIPGAGCEQGQDLKKNSLLPRTGLQILGGGWVGCRAVVYGNG